MYNALTAQLCGPILYASIFWNLLKFVIALNLGEAAKEPQIYLSFGPVVDTTSL